MKKQKRPRDINVRAASTVALVTGETLEEAPEAKPVPEASPEERHSAAVTLGRKGGQSRAKRLTPEQRKEIAEKAANARWQNPSNKTGNKNYTVNTELLELARRSRGYSQSELARALSVSHGWLSQVEGGLKEITEDKLRRIAEILDYPTTFFYGQRRVLGPGISNMFHHYRR